jgi:hypothetical protein
MTNPGTRDLQIDKTRIAPLHSTLLIKHLSTENKERILKAAREKCQITYKGKSIRTEDFQHKP